MTGTHRRLLAAIIGVALSASLASGCSELKGIGDSSGNKIKQGGDAGGSTGYP